jgi:hypothetical protein
MIGDLRSFSWCAICDENFLVKKEGLLNLAQLLGELHKHSKFISSVVSTYETGGIIHN